MICPPFTSGGPSTIAGALRSVDCMAGQATVAAFGRIFGSHGVLTGALTIGLTLYVALFAIGLLTGRFHIGLSSLTPRMMALGLALTLATSWIAYSQVVWTLLSAGPDWIASSVLGTKGSATQVFADRLDGLFQAVADAAQEAVPGADEAKQAATTTPGQLLSYAALLLLLGTVGVLVTSRIALAALLAVGPIFMILSLFSGTRGLFEGWVKAAVMFALVPLFTVLIGVGAVAMLTPVVADLQEGSVDLEHAAIVFVAAAVHCALMIMSLKLVTNLTSGWRLPFSSPLPRSADRAAAVPGTFAVSPALSTGAAAPRVSGPEPVASRDERVRAVVAAMSRPMRDGASHGETRAVIQPGPGSVGGLLREQTSPGRLRAQDTGRGLRSPASTQSIKETLA